MRVVASANDNPNDLVTGNKRCTHWWQFAVNDMQIGAAYAAHSHLEQHLASGGHRHWTFDCDQPSVHEDRNDMSSMHSMAIKKLMDSMANEMATMAATWIAILRR